MQINKKSNNLINTKIDTKILLSALWTTIMFLFVYADLKAIYQTGTVDAIINGEIIGMKINQMFLLSSAILMSLPAIMIFISLFLKPMINRFLNIVIAILFIVINTMTYLIPNEGVLWYYYVYFTTLECIICIVIIALALKWPKSEIGSTTGNRGQPSHCFWSSKKAWEGRPRRLGKMGGFGTL